MQAKVIQAKFYNQNVNSAMQARNLGGMSLHGLTTPDRSRLQTRNGITTFSLDASQIGMISGTGMSLPNSTRTHMENVFNADFSEVRVHVGPQAGRIGAVAFTKGFDIFFAPGKFQPETRAGRELLGHELAHVVQQRCGLVHNISGIGISVVHDPNLEAEADRMGQRAALQKILGVNTIVARPQLFNIGKIRDSIAIQRQTSMIFSRPIDRPGTDKITTLVHGRSPHTSNGKLLAAWLSGYHPVPNGKICNHHISYKLLSAAVAKRIETLGSLDLVATWINSLVLPGAETYDSTILGFPMSGNRFFSVGAMPKPAVTSTIAMGINYYSEFNLNKQIDDLIFNLANDPRNLFFWHQSTGDQGGQAVDYPQGDWNDTLASLAVVDLRLNNYRQGLARFGPEFIFK